VSKALSFEMGAVMADARIAYQEARLQDAETLVRQVLSAYPNNPEALYLLGAVAYRAHQYADSARYMQRVVALQPSHHDAQLTLGMAYRAMRKMPEARVALRKAVDLKPSSMDARYNLALTELDAGDLKAAAKHLERAVKINPESAHVRNTFAGVLFHLGEREESMRQLRKAAALAPESAEMQQNLGVALANNGEHAEAVEQFRAVLRLQPDHPDALYGLATSLMQVRQLDEAYTLFQRLLKEGPKMVPPRSNYGLALRHGNRPHEAVEQLRQALKDSHGEPFIASNLAEALVNSGASDEAMQVMRASFEARPSEGIALQLGDLLARLGKFSEAAAQFERVLGRQPENVVALVSLVDIHGKDLAREHEDRLTVVANDERRVPLHRFGAHLALGRLYDARGDYARAFENFAAGNKQRAGWQAFDMAAFRATIARQIAFFTPEFLAAHRDQGSESDLPVFLVGLPRAGLSITERMIAAHTRGWGLGEVQDLTVLARRLPALVQPKSEPGWGDLASLAGQPSVAASAKVEYPECLRDLTAEVGKPIADDFVALRQRHASNAKRVADKSAPHWQFIGLARLMFPRAAVVHVTRDPLDTLLSIFANQLPGDHPFPSDLAALGVYWREHQRLMAHWRTLGALPEIKYEDLVASPEATAKALLAAVGLGWEPQVLRCAELARPVPTQSKRRLREPLTSARVGNAKNYAEFLKPLKDALER